MDILDVLLPAPPFTFAEEATYPSRISPRTTRKRKANVYVYPARVYILSHPATAQGAASAVAGRGRLTVTASNPVVSGRASVAVSMGIVRFTQTSPVIPQKATVIVGRQSVGLVQPEASAIVWQDIHELELLGIF